MVPKDPNGNQLTKTVGNGPTAVLTTNVYDIRDKLAEVQQTIDGATSILARYQYDAEGRLLKKIGAPTVPGGSGIRQYVYDQTSRLVEYDETGTAVARFNYGSDRLISMWQQGEGTRFYHLDGLRSVIALTDTTGAVTANLRLDTWGNFRFPTTDLASTANRFAFTGHVFEAETGLYYAKARFLDPKLGRFISQDSFLGQIDEPPSLHRYLYARNQPTVYVDPDGNIAVIDNAIGGVASVAIGWGVAKLTGEKYTWKDAAVDFGLGAVTSGLSSLTKLKHASKLVKWGARALSETAVDTGAEVARKEWKGEEYTAGEIAQGAATNLVIGEAGAAAGRKIAKWWRGSSQAQKAVNIEESHLGRGDAPEPGASADVSARPAGNSAAPPPPEVSSPPKTYAFGEPTAGGWPAGTGPGAAPVFESAFSPQRALLPGELRVGPYGDLKRSVAGDSLTPHHGPSVNWLKQVGISRDEGIAIMMEHNYPANTGRHADTRTFRHLGKSPDLLTENFRTALGRDVRDVRKIYQDQGLYGDEVRGALHEWIAQWRELNARRMLSDKPDLFARTPKAP